MIWVQHFCFVFFAKREFHIQFFDRKTQQLGMDRDLSLSLSLSLSCFFLSVCVCGFDDWRNFREKSRHANSKKAITWLSKKFGPPRSLSLSLSLYFARNKSHDRSRLLNLAPSLSLSFRLDIYNTNTNRTAPLVVCLWIHAILWKTLREREERRGK